MITSRPNDVDPVSTFLLAGPRDPYRPDDNPHANPLGHTHPVRGLPLPSELGPDLPVRPYRDVEWELARIKHWGQRKLLMNEIQFLTRHGHRSDLVVYAGAAPGTHAPLLMAMFPRHVFHLWDPAPFSRALHDRALLSTGRLHLYNEYFTDDSASSYFGRDVLFICDIRAFSSDPAQLEISEREKDIIENMNMQKRWCKAIKPAYAMLKFRLPWLDPKRSSEPIAPVRYFCGQINLQPWAPKFSTELRLVTDCADERDYDPFAVDGQCFYVNTVLRRATFPRGPAVSGPVGLCCCYDCSLELDIMSEFCAADSLLDAELAKFERHSAGAEAGKVVPPPLASALAERHSVLGELDVEALVRSLARSSPDAPWTADPEDRETLGWIERSRPTEARRVGEPVSGPVAGHPEGMSVGERLLFWEFEIQRAFRGASVFGMLDRKVVQANIRERQSKGKHKLPWFS